MNCSGSVSVSRSSSSRCCRYRHPTTSIAKMLNLSLDISLRRPLTAICAYAFSLLNRALIAVEVKYPCPTSTICCRYRTWFFWSKISLARHDSIWCKAPIWARLANPTRGTSRQTSVTAPDACGSVTPAGSYPVNAPWMMALAIFSLNSSPCTLLEFSRFSWRAGSYYPPDHFSFLKFPWNSQNPIFPARDLWAGRTGECPHTLDV